jgi:hypothetical protein
LVQVDEFGHLGVVQTADPPPGGPGEVLQPAPRRIVALDVTVDVHPNPYGTAS